MKPEDFPDSTFGVWRQNCEVFRLFTAMQTQWRTGFRGATGFDYNALPVVFRMHGIKRKDQPELFELLRVMEQEALLVMHEKE